MRAEQAVTRQEDSELSPHTYKLTPHDVTWPGSGGLVRDGETVERRELNTTAPRAAAPGQAHRSMWVFSGGECDGEELLPALRRYLDWMRDEIISEAECLLTLVE
jgi:hypothetical protein